MTRLAVARAPADSGRLEDPNHPVYNKAEVAEYYAAVNYLTPCEQLLFDAYLRPGMAIVDLGVGGGRTTAHLSSIASRYVGVDYASEMIASCRKKFPQLEFDLANAADLSKLTSSTFDAGLIARAAENNRKDPRVLLEEAILRRLRGKVQEAESLFRDLLTNPASARGKKLAACSSPAEF